MPKTPPLTLPTPIDPPEGAMVVSFSELDTFRQCPLKHMLAYNQRWSKPKDEGSALSRGSLWHAVMELHYQSLQADDLQGRPRSLATAGENVSFVLFDDRGIQTPDQELAQWMYEGYVDLHGTDEQWEILGVEYKLADWIPDPTRDGESSGILLKGRLDLIVRDRTTRKIWVVDHKSGANLPSAMDLEIDDQFGIYTWFLRSRGLPVLGALHNAARTTRNTGDFPGAAPRFKPQTLDQRMHRTLLTRSDLELENLIRDAWAVAENILATGLGERPLYSSPDPRQCGWKCDFKEVHISTRKGIPMQAALEDAGFRQDFSRH